MYRCAWATLSVDGLRCSVSRIQLWWTVMSAVVFSVQPMPNALFSWPSRFQETVRYVVSLRLSMRPSAMCRMSLWSIHTWWAPSIWMPS